MEKTLNLIIEKLDSLDQKVDEMDQRLTAEQRRQGDLIHQLINTVAATNVRISETNEKMSAIETKEKSLVLSKKAPRIILSMIVPRLKQKKKNTAESKRKYIQE